LTRIADEEEEGGIESAARNISKLAHALTLVNKEQEQRTVT